MRQPRLNRKIWIASQEAARQYGVGVSTLRSWAAAGQLERRYELDGLVRVVFYRRRQLTDLIRQRKAEHGPAAVS